MMFEELKSLLTCVKDLNASKEDYYYAINENNCLNKRSANNRNYSAKYLEELYGLDPNITLFRLLRYFWERDEESRPLIALLCCYSRDTLFRKSAGYIINKNYGDSVTRIELERYLHELMPDYYSDTTLSSIAKNINSSWTQAGLVNGGIKKIRSKANPAAGAAAYALVLSYLAGARGEIILDNSFIKLLDCAEGKTIELAEAASRSGWIVFKKVSSIIEAQFPALLTKEEMEWVNEQNR
jgi:hypothetical protein